MLLSFFVYGFMIFSMYWLGVFASQRTNVLVIGRHKSQLISLEVLLIFFIFSFFAAVRWQVGVDFSNYKAGYDAYTAHGLFERENFEIGHKAIILFCNWLGLSSIAMFAIYAFLQIFFIYNRFNDEKYLYPYLGLLIVCFGFISMMNGMRQWLATAIFIYSTRYIIDRKLIKYLLCMLLAFLFHKSAVILIPLYLLANKEIFTSRNINILLIIGSTIIGMTPTWFTSIDSVTPFLELMGYDFMAERGDVIIEESQRSMAFGPQRITLILLPIIITFFAKTLTRYYRSFNILFTLMLIGVIGFNLFANTSSVFLRPMLYFNFFTQICTAYLLHYLITKSTTVYSKLLYSFIICISIFYIFWASYKGLSAEIDYSNYKFIFDKV